MVILSRGGISLGGAASGWIWHIKCAAEKMSLNKYSLWAWLIKLGIYCDVQCMVVSHARPKTNTTLGYYYSQDIQLDLHV